MGGTLTSVLLHGAIVTGVIALGVRATPIDARTTDVPIRDIFYVPIPRPLEARPDHAAPSTTLRPNASAPTPVTLPAFDHVSPRIPPVDLEAAPITDRMEFSRGVSTGTDRGEQMLSLGAPSDGVVEERLVDRAPRILGTPIQPPFPTSLRERGLGGRVAVQFVVDTLGRAEMSSLRVVEASDPQFVQSVRAVLSRYRFLPGELGGRKVRTLVQLPFEFTLVR